MLFSFHINVHSHSIPSPIPGSQPPNQKQNLLCKKRSNTCRLFHLSKIHPFPTFATTYLIMNLDTFSSIHAHFLINLMLKSKLVSKKMVSRSIKEDFHGAQVAPCINNRILYKVINPSFSHRSNSVQQQKTDDSFSFHYVQQISNR